MSNGEVDEIVSNPHAYELIPPPPEQERMRIFYYVLFAMQMDGKVHPAEEELVYKAGLKLGFQQNMIKEMVDVLKNHLTTRVPDGVLVEIIKKYLN